MNIKKGVVVSSLSTTVIRCPTIIILFALQVPYTHAGLSDGTVDGDNGVLHVSGIITESACRLEMQSKDQTVDMGTIATGDLPQVGHRGAPIAVQLRLRDCVRSASDNLDMLGNISWSASQPAMSLTFFSEHDERNPQLIHARGVSGVGLRLTDSAQRDLVLGQSSKPLFLTPGSDVITYFIMPERTSAPLQSGAYFASVNFRLSYD